MKTILYIFVFMGASITYSQNPNSGLPYYEIPDYPEEFTAGTVAARMVDGLGFRYYWATEGLTAEDLEFKPNEDARAIKETLDHIYGLSKLIVDSTLKKPNGNGDEDSELTFKETRERTLYNFKTAADILRRSEDISQFKIVFKSNKGESSIPFWNQINGPIEDAVWHCGQVVLLRRSSGNPFNPKVNLFSGKVRQ